MPVLKCECVILESPKTGTDPPQPDCTAASADSQSWCAQSDHSCSPKKIWTVSKADRKSSQFLHLHGQRVEYGTSNDRVMGLILRKSKNWSNENVYIEYNVSHFG